MDPLRKKRYVKFMDRTWSLNYQAWVRFLRHGYLHNGAVLMDGPGVKELSKNSNPPAYRLISIRGWIADDFRDRLLELGEPVEKLKD